MKRQGKIGGIVLLLVLVSLLIAGTLVMMSGRGDEKESEPRRKLTLYSSLKTMQLERIENHFEILHPDIDLVFLSSGSGNVLQLVEAENRSGKVECDVIWCAEPHGYLPLVEKNILAPLDLSPYPDLPKFEGVDNRYMAAARLIDVGLALNTARYAEGTGPESFKDLLECDDVILPDPYSSGSALFAVTVLASKYGWQYFSSLKERGARVCNGSNASLYQVWEGTGSVTIAPEYLVRAAEGMGKPVRYKTPKDIPIVIPSPIAIIQGCKNPDDAKTFVSFILSDSGQALLYSLDITPSRGEYATSSAHTFPIPDVEGTLSRFDLVFLGQRGR